MKHLVVDTNVAVVANAKDTHASAQCVTACCEHLQRITAGKVRLVLDAENWVFGEYRKGLSLAGQPGVGDLFMRWVHTNRHNPARCELVGLTALPGSEWRAFAEVPDDPDVKGFDRDDHVFLAVSRASTARPPILNAVDSDWWDYERVLARHGVKVTYVCQDQVAAWRRERTQQGGPD